MGGLDEGGKCERAGHLGERKVARKDPHRRTHEGREKKPVEEHPQASFDLARGESPALCNSRRRNHEVWSHREAVPGHCSISEKILSVQMSTFDI